MGHPPRLLVDEMLGRLARWLRVLGYDTVWERGVADDALLERAERESRLLLTRDTLLMQRRVIRRGRVAALLVRPDLLQDQLAQLASDLPLQRVSEPRCLVCNGELRSVSARFAAPRVPPYVAATQPVFRYCAVCDRVVWQGTHWEEMLRVLRGVGVPSTCAVWEDREHSTGGHGGRPEGGPGGDAGGASRA